MAEHGTDRGRGRGVGHEDPVRRATAATPARSGGQARPGSRTAQAGGGRAGQPKAPDIALEKIKEQKKKLADKKLAEEKLREELKQEKLKELADKKAKAATALAEQKKLDKLREQEVKRMMANLGGTGTAEKSTAPRIDTGYRGRREHQDQALDLVRGRHRRARQSGSAIQDRPVTDR
ncbi:hypothetical protein LP420_06690 [Massilia sp. B-10]|nr:hypothetical protein LP420_06690 [Massilia sp. B-10]